MVCFSARDAHAPVAKRRFEEIAARKLCVQPQRNTRERRRLPRIAQSQASRALMDIPSESMRAWARRLLASEASSSSAPESNERESVRVFEKLRMSLTQFVGADGFTALMRRALALARKEVPSLQTAKITAEGRLEGIGEHPADATTDAEEATAITAHLLALLVTFVGEPLTARLMRDLWPDAPHPTTAESEDLK